MQELRTTEGEIFWLHGVPVGVAYARYGRLVLYGVNCDGETQDDLRRRMKRFDKARENRENTGDVIQPG